MNKKTPASPKQGAKNTPGRILAKSLHLFNEFGEPNITTNMLAEHLEISPGNLYYHFRNKEDIVNSLFAEFEKDIHGHFYKCSITMSTRWVAHPLSRASQLTEVT